jgi:hypothetical protein
MTRERLTFIRQRDPTLFLMLDIELGTGKPGVSSIFPPFFTTEALGTVRSEACMEKHRSRINPRANYPVIHRP